MKKLLKFFGLMPYEQKVIRIGDIKTIDFQKFMLINIFENNRQVWLLLDAPEDKMTWDQATEWCESKRGVLPCLNVLKFMVREYSTINKNITKAGGRPLEDKSAWSSYDSRDDVWVTNLLSGNIKSDFKSTAQNFVRCVIYF